MRILDAKGRELSDSAELRAQGTFEPETIKTVYHSPVTAVKEVGHYETIAEYQNGGTDVEWVVDVPGRAAADEWWEEEEVLRFIPFTAAELAAQKIASLTAELRSTDAVVLETLEGLLSCTSMTAFLAALASAAEQLHDTIESRATLREQITQARGGES